MMFGKFIGGFQEYKLLERLGEGSKPTAIIGEVADDLNLDLVVISIVFISEDDDPTYD